MKVAIVAGTRPEFIKVLSILRVLPRYRHQFAWVHTGQHYTKSLSDAVCGDIHMPSSVVHISPRLGDIRFAACGVKEELLRLLKSMRPDAVMVVGDTDSALAGATASKRNGLPLIHIEAGLRSGQKSMVEEQNRISIDRMSDLLLVTETAAYLNLIREGLEPYQRLAVVGNTVADSVSLFSDSANMRQRMRVLRREISLISRSRRAFGLVTIHRAEHVEDRKTLEPLLEAVSAASKRLPMVVLAHPHFTKCVDRFGLGYILDRAAVEVIEPLFYRDFLALMSHARLVMTDSGGVQEETTVLGVPCLTIRESTERPVTTYLGSNRVVGIQPSGILRAFEESLKRPFRFGSLPPYWDGHSADRVASLLNHWRPVRHAVA